VAVLTGEAAQFVLEADRWRDPAPTWLGVRFELGAVLGRVVEQVDAGHPGAAAGLVHRRTQLTQQFHHVHRWADGVWLAVFAGDEHIGFDVAPRGAVLRADLFPARWCRPQQRPADASDQLLLVFA
jgi:hypothetical protein